MNIGDILTLKPTIDASSGFALPDVLPCTVIYIHPLRRFFVVEFRVGGYAWRETFYFEARPNRTGVMGKELKKQSRPRHYGRML